jgi:putative SOS response-associated peptidase YedK
MPAILHPEEYSLWLEGEARERESLMELLRPYPADEMVGYPVSDSINSPRNQGAELIEQAPVNSA